MTVLCVLSTAGLTPVLAERNDEGAAQPASSLPAYLERYSRPFVIDGREFKFTQKYYWHRLFHPEMKDKVRGAGVLMASFVLATQKNRIQADVAEDDSPPRERFFRQAQDFGGKGIVPAIAALFYVGGSAFHDYRAKETGFMLAESGLFTGILTVTGMWILSEDRPRDGGRLHPFQGIGHGVSGHAATAASVSGVLSRMYLQVDPEDSHTTVLWKRIGKGLAYGMPAIVAFGRVNDQQHYLYNTILGLSIGYWSGNVVADAHGFYIHGTPSRFRPSAVGPITNDRGAPGIGARWEY